MLKEVRRVPQICVLKVLRDPEVRVPKVLCVQKFCVLRFFAFQSFVV